MKSQAEWFEEYQHQWGFVLPAEYVTLAKQSAFDLPHRTGTYYVDLIDSAYLWVQEMEWRSFPDLLRPDTTAREVKPGFASFAFTGGGDEWCWHSEYAAGGRVPVLYCPRDERNATFYAPDFITAVYRNILEAARGGFGCNENDPVERQYLRRWSDQLSPLLPRPAAQSLRRLLSAPVKEFTYCRSTQKGLVTPDELKLIIQRDIAFDLLGKEIEWVSFE